MNKAKEIFFEIFTVDFCLILSILLIFIGLAVSEDYIKTVTSRDTVTQALSSETS